jgi:hypothetical protein
MLDLRAKAHIPSPDRTHLVAATEEEADRCDVFRIDYFTGDGIYHEQIATLTTRCLVHKVKDKHIIVLSVFETINEQVRSFIDRYKGQIVTVTKRQFNYDTGQTTFEKEYRCTFESGLLPFMCDLPNKPATFELLFIEV